MSKWDLIVIGSGPAGQEAALAASAAGLRVALVERDTAVGGACLHRGTIPSKTLREAALELCRMRSVAESIGVEFPPQLRLDFLTERLHTVIDGHAATIGRNLDIGRVELVHGTGRLLSNTALEVQYPGGVRETFEAKAFIFATGSQPRTPDDVPVDHEQVLDSDSILSLEYLPESMTILGGGVIASEYASIFATLGVRVTMIDRGPRPLAFLSDELSASFRESFELMGGRYLGNSKISDINADGFARVTTTLEDGLMVSTEKMMVALGRVPCSARLGFKEVGVELNHRGYVVVDESWCSKVPGVYAVGDLIGAPALASAAMQQGRQAAAHACGLGTGVGSKLTPIGIFTIPEIATVGLTEEQAAAKHGAVVVGRAEFERLARGSISGVLGGKLKLIADGAGEHILGIEIIGEGATELVSMGQMNMLLGGRAADFVDNLFNFPTMAEAYRIAALDLAARVRGQRLAA